MNASVFFLLVLSLLKQSDQHIWIRINFLGYRPESIKVAVWCSKGNEIPVAFELVEEATGKAVYKNTTGKSFGPYGPFSQTYRLDFSKFHESGRFYLRSGEVKSKTFSIGADVYKGAADFGLRYMRQQRSGFNPYLKDSCHTHDGYTLYGPMPDSTHINVSGGWHDASDYLQYVTTSANATYHLLMAYRDFPEIFADEKQANGLDGKNGRADVLDEAQWGLDWLVKMNPKEDWMFNQLGDDRDHINMRIPKEDSQYGRGFERPAYFVNGKPQQQGKSMNHTTGTSSTAGKFSSAFSLGSLIFAKQDIKYSQTLKTKAFSAYRFGKEKLGVSQTTSVRSPYIYAESNWTDDMELAAASLSSLKGNNNYQEEAFQFAQQEPVTPWLGTDTASHYQWYPFINVGHYELARQLKGKQRDTLTSYYRKGIEKVWDKAKLNAFFRGVPFIWCSNNLTVSFAIQCYWYRQLTGDAAFSELEQANLDWILGCNPWGTSMIYGLPSWADTPKDPHSAFTHLKNYPIDGGLVDGPVYTRIFNSLLGLQLSHEDEYSAFQSDLAVYHDDYGDYSTNEPTMDGTASLIYLLASRESKNNNLRSRKLTYQQGAIIRGDTAKKQIALVFTGDLFAEGGGVISATLKTENVHASFFLTGNFYRNSSFHPLVQKLINDGHYLAGHSDKHLLYCDWTRRDSLLVTKGEFKKDLLANYAVMNKSGIIKSDAKYFLPPYEWYNDSIALWTQAMDLELINYTPGTLSHADYTSPDMPAYRSSETIFKSIIDREATMGLNGYILLMHIGTDPRRKDKFYNSLDKLIVYLKSKEYRLVKVNELLKE